MVNMHDITFMSVLYFMKLRFTKSLDKPPNLLCCLLIQSKSTVAFYLVDLSDFDQIVMTKSNVCLVNK